MDATTPPPPFSSPEFAQAWADWVQCRKEQRKPLRPTTVRYQFRQLAKLTERHAVETLLYSIANGYQGLFPDAVLRQRREAGGRVSQRTSYAQATLADALGLDDPQGDQPCQANSPPSAPPRPGSSPGPRT
jgi:hypothetical protein